MASEPSSAVSGIDQSFGDLCSVAGSCSTRGSQDAGTPAVGAADAELSEHADPEAVFHVHNVAGDTMQLRIDPALYTSDEFALFGEQVPKLEIADVLDIFWEEFCATRQPKGDECTSPAVPCAARSSQEGESLLRKLPVPRDMVKLMLVSATTSEDSQEESRSTPNSVLRFLASDDGECTGVEFDVEALTRRLADAKEEGQTTVPVCEQTVTWGIKYDEFDVSDADRLERLLVSLTPEYPSAECDDAYLRRHELRNASSWWKFRFRFEDPHYRRLKRHPDAEMLHESILHELHHLRKPESIASDQRITSLCGALVTRALVLQLDPVVRWLVHAGAAVLFNSFDARETCPLHAAASSPGDDPDHLHIVLAAIGDANIEAYDERGRTALHCAIEKGNIRCMEALGSAGASVHTVGLHDQLTLSYALSDPKVLESVLRHKPDVNQYLDPEEKRWNALLGAVMSSQAPCVRLLLEAGADVEATYGTPDSCTAGGTPLHEASRGYREHDGYPSRVIETIDALLEAGADVGARDAHGCKDARFGAMTPRNGLSLVMGRKPRHR